MVANVQQQGGRRARRFLIAAALIVVAYLVVAVVLRGTKDFSAQGPLALDQPERTEALPGAITPAKALDACFPDRDPTFRYKVVGGVVDGRPLYACYERAGTGRVNQAKVVDAEGYEVTDAALLKRSGAWPYIGPVKSTTDLAWGAVGVVALLGLFGLYYRRARPGPGPSPWWRSPPMLWLLMLLWPIVGWLAVLVMPGLSFARKRRLTFQLTIVWAGFVLFVIVTIVLEMSDPWGLSVLGFELAAFWVGLLGGRAWLRPPGWGAIEQQPAAVPAVAAPWPPPQGPPVQQPVWAPPPVPTPEPAPAPEPGRIPVKAPSNRDGAAQVVRQPGELPDFADVGGMDALKRELKGTIGLVLAFAGEAESYRITWNGILLHGRPGVGKTFIAKATAGEFGLNFIHVTAGDLVSSYRGESARNVEAAFRHAAANIPCVLFFDEFDSVAQRREDWPDQESRRTVNQLLQTLEEFRQVRPLIVMAATNDISQLDPAVIRPGRFDRQIRVDLPDAAGRAAIFRVALHGRPASEVDYDLLAERSEHLTPAAISRAIEMAALEALRETARVGVLVKLDTPRLLAGLAALGGEDRPSVTSHGWDELVLPAPVKAELRQLQALLERPDDARRLGIDLPSGVLLTGPPGTGKTTIARVLAAQAHCSFYPVTAADLTSMWVGESEQRVRRLFERARENQPSIVFIDEIDAIASERGSFRALDSQVNQLLAEMDGIAGQQGVFVLAATNRPEKLDPALLRGGRLSRQIEIPPPDQAGRLALLQLMTRAMTLDGVDLATLAGRTEGYTGADLKALCQQAALAAMIRTTGGGPVQVTRADFSTAIATRKSGQEPPPKAGQYI